MQHTGYRLHKRAGPCGAPVGRTSSRVVIKPLRRPAVRVWHEVVHSRIRWAPDTAAGRSEGQLASTRVVVHPFLTITIRVLRVPKAHYARILRGGIGALLNRRQKLDLQHHPLRRKIDCVPDAITVGRVLEWRNRPHTGCTARVLSNAVEKADALV